MCMSDIFCVTNRALCCEDFLSRLETIASCQPAGIILREKDLSPAEYKALAAGLMKICTKHNVSCILHSFTAVAAELQAQSIHLPLHILRSMSADEKRRFKTIGASCHSLQEALEAQELGCSYIIAGHIFETDCKKGLAGRGTDFLQEVCSAVTIPVYAIGGIHEDNIASVRRAGAKGVCLMSSLMVSDDPAALLRSLEVR